MRCIFIFTLAMAFLFNPVSQGAETSRRQRLVFLNGSCPVLVSMAVEVEGKGFQERWEAFINHVFTTLDGNKDGVLSGKELARIPPPSTLFNSGAAFFTPLTAGPNQSAADANKDGKVTREELARYYESQGGAAFGLSFGEERANRGIVILSTGGRSIPTTEMNQRLFRLLDTDKDGKLSRKELAAAPVLLKNLDADDDEVLTPQEVMGEAANDGGYPVAPQIVGSSTSQEGNPFVHVPHKGEAKEMVDRLLRTYGGPQAKTLTRQQLGLDEARFKQLDTNKDGVLDRMELARFGQGPPDLELKVKVGKNEGIELVAVRTHPGAQASQVSKKANGKILFQLGFTEFELGQGQPGGGLTFAKVNVADVYKMQFTQADEDNNGYLDTKEAQKSGIFRGAFAQMDRDGDGKLFLKEVLTYLSEIEELQKKAGDACITLSVSEQGNGLFEMLDSNGDAHLGLRELRQAVGLLDKLDHDRDNYIRWNEIPRRYQANLERGPAGIGGGAVGVVAVATVDMFNQRRTSGETPRGPRWFHKMDRNRDGDVSRREFIGTPELFRKIDTDGDGLISLAEAEKADAEQRKKK